MNLGYAPQAADDLERIWEYYAERAGPKAAEELVLRIVLTLERLVAKNPHAGRLRPELGPTTRSFPVLPFVVFYQTAGKRVRVQRILHGHRDVHPPLVSLLLAV